MIKLITISMVISMSLASSIECKKHQNTNKNENNVSSTNKSVNNNTNEKQEPIEKIEGIVRLVGNEPFSYLVVTTDKKVSYRLPPEKKAEYAKYQMKRVQVSGSVKTKVLESADRKHKFNIKYIYPTTFNVLKNDATK